MKTKIKILLLLTVTMLMSCNNDDDTSSNNSNTSYNYGATVNRDFHGIILDTNGNPISGATVTIGSETTQTTSSGFFVLTNVSVKENFAYVKVTKSGFINGSRTLKPTTGSNRVHIMLIPNTPTATISSGSSGTVSLPNGTQVVFDGSFEDQSGNAYSGNVSVALHHLKPTDTYLNEIMPGSLLASNNNDEAKVLETFGMLHVELTGSSGQKLNIANGHTAEISMEIDPIQLSSAPSSIPLWSFNESTGMWKEEGSATKIGNKYVGNVSHFSWWNCDTPLDFCTLNMAVTDSNSNPISNILITLERTVGSWVDSRVAFTDGNGNASGLIPANSNLTMKIYDQCGTLISTSNIGPFASGSTNSLTTSLTSSISLTNVTGVLQDCNGNNVTNGLAYLNGSGANIPGWINYFYYYNMSQPITNGNFNFNIVHCGNNVPLEFSGEDYNNLQTTGTINFVLTSPTTNLGIIQACTATNEFISFKIDNNPTQYIISNISAGTIQGFYINGSSVGGNSSMYIYSTAIPNIGTTYTSTTFSAEFYDGIIGDYFGPGTTMANNVQFVVSQIGAIGGYIDMTMNGTYTDQGGAQHTITCTVHAIRDN